MYSFSKYKDQYKSNLRLALPVVLTQLGQILTQVADNLMVGRYGGDDPVPLAAVSFGGAVFFILFIAAIGIALGMTPLVGELYAQGDREKSAGLLQNGILFYTLLGFAMAAVQYAVIPLMYDLGQPVEVVDMAIPYYKMLVFSMPFVMLFFAFKQFLEGVGNTKVEMVVTIIANMANIGFNAVFIYGRFGLPEMGAEGAGLGTLLSRIIAPILMIGYFYNRHKYRGYLDGFSPRNYSWATVKNLLHMGLPISMQMFLEASAFVGTGIMMGWFGKETMSANQIAVTIGNCAFMIVMSIGAATTIRVSHCYGARNIGELRADILKAKSFIPGTHRLNLHEIYGEFGGETVDRDQVEPRHFQGWIEWAKEHGMKLDFNSTSFSHPKSGDLSLANPDPGIRDFWVEHTKRCRAIAEEMGKAQGDPSIMNLWVHDGSKDLTVNRMLYRELLRDSLDRIFETEYDHMKDCIESKVFGIGLESYTVGSNDFYIGYGASRGKIVTLDTGHFHPTEIVADKISSLLLFIPEVMLHVSRPVRWDSDHVTIMNDDTLELCKEIVRCDALDRVHIGLDYFDASINRIGAYVIGSRATQKCLMQALLEPLAQLRRYEAAGQGFERLALLEESKSLPWNAVWDMFCLRNDVPVGEEFIAGIQQYEREVTSKR